MIQKYIGTWSNRDFESALQKFTKDPDWQYVERTLTDLRGSKLDLAAENIQNIAKIRNNIIEEEHYNVLLVDKPIPTAVVHLYVEEFKNKFNYVYCSTIEHVKEKLDLKESISEIEHIINTLNN